MLSSVASFTLQEDEARAVRVEVDVHRGLPSFSIVGLADVAVREERERVRAALVNCGFEYPVRRVVVNLAPLARRHSAPELGLAIATGLLLASGQLEPERFAGLALAGGLALSGEVRAVRDVAKLAEAARAEGRAAIVVPAGQGVEAVSVAGIGVYEVERLGELGYLAGGELEPLVAPADPAPWRPRACVECQRRGHLLAALAPHLEAVYASSRGRSVRELLCLPNHTLAENVAPKEATEILAALEELTEERLEQINSEAGCWALCRCAPGFPASLAENRDGPWAIFGRGDPEVLRDLAPAEAVAVIGSRRTTSYGRGVGRELGRELAAAGLVVISGLAFGIDGCAHRGALEDGRTIAVLATGADVPYPTGHRAVYEQIRERGAVLSEMPPGTGGWRWSFAARNRIVAALAATTIVVEARERSGTSITVEFARQMGREIAAVPCPINSPVSALPNQLLAEGARLIRGADDLPAAHESKGA
jgi:DNA processing protein